MPFIFKIKFIIPDPPTSPYASAFPLILVILVTAIKQSYEDFLRHKEDWKVNSKKIRVLREGKFETINVVILSKCWSILLFPVIYFFSILKPKMERVM